MGRFAESRAARPRGLHNWTLHCRRTVIREADDGGLSPDWDASQVRGVRCLGISADKTLLRAQANG